ncbi:MAG: DUF4065 domain-containing protein [Eubacteriaceae bacterium]|jgi:uncharacterized phage-associated protein|nr:DUF4065 domain-containing protein [Eubacteriaceae bacterium]
MASVYKVAKYILEYFDRPIDAYKLQKLVYYCQAWSLVWDEKPLFDDKIEAWVNGPVVRSLYKVHQGQYSVKPEDFVDLACCGGELSEEQKETIDAVLAYYGGMKGYELRELTHLEKPWQIAREGMGDIEPGSREIACESMQMYYASL